MTRKVRTVFVWPVALGVLGTACATSGAVPRPFPVPGSTASNPARLPAGREGAVTGPAENPASEAAIARQSLTETALEFLGVRYRHGGTDPAGFDCSGFTQYVFARHGLALPREVRDQFRAGTPVDRDELRPGDLLFFTTTAPGASHVAIALDGNQFVHAPSSTGVVRVEALAARHWSHRYVGARRIRRE
jgi:cell wall-associated NlpC family hydrolase